MTRKDYVAIAETFASRLDYMRSNCDCNTPVNRAALFAIEGVANDLCAVLRNDNPRFDRERFLKACGVQS